MLKATKIRLYPTPEQAVFLNAQFGAVRFTYNKALHIICSQYSRHGLSLRAKRDIKPLLAVAKRSRKYFWLKDYDSIALQQACINLDQSFQNFFNPKLPAKYPCFKSKHGKQSSYHCMGVKAGEDWIKIPKLGEIKARVHRELVGTLKSITLTRTVTGKHYASLLMESGVCAPEPAKHIDKEAVLGLDMGITHLVIDSEGRKEVNPRFLKNAKTNLRCKQKSLSRCTKGSKGRAKARLTLAKAHERVANVRADYQHKLSRRLIDENQAVSVETLKVKNMLKNRKLSKHIADAAWSSLIQKLEYKAREQGKHFVKIDQWFASSKTCHYCGHKVDELPLNVRKWDCPTCEIDNDRDINAAINIRQQGILKLKADGLTVSANGGLRKSGNLPVAA